MPGCPPSIMTNPVRILHIAPGEPFGGVQRIVLNLAAHQAPDHAVAVLWTGAADRALAQMPASGVSAMTASGSPVSRIIAARRAVKSFGPDVIHLHMPPPWAAFALGSSRAAVCYHLHGPPREGGGEPGAQLATWLDARIIARADMLIAISDWIENAWRKDFPQADYRSVFNGIPPGSGKAVIRSVDAANPAIIGFASRLAPDKGVDEFATFALALSRKVSHVRFRVAGEGPDRTLLENRLKPLIASGMVELLGHVTDMPAFWAQLDLAIFSAPGEPFGLRLIEPVAEGVPVIAYETGAGSDEIARNCAGIATVPYEQAEAMAELAAELLDDPGRRARMAQAGQRDIERSFSIASMAAGVDAVYSEILASKGGKSH